MLLLLMNVTEVFSQSFWNITPNTANYVSVGNDTSLTNLKKQVLKDKWYVSDDALILLAYYYGGQEKAFILENLEKPPSDTSAYLYWEKFYFYNLIRGYLGVPEAIAAMDSVAKYDDEWELKVRAIISLAEAGNYNHFNMVKKAFKESKKNYFLLLKAYSQSTYQDEIGNYLVKIIQDSTAFIVLQAAALYSDFNKERTIKLLENRFYNSKGESRKLFFDRLGLLDRKEQPKKSILALKNESNNHLMVHYIPAFKWIREGKISQAYLSPSFILFLNELYNKSTSILVRGHIKNGFLEVYKPLPSKPSVSELKMLDSLITIKDLIASEEFGWIGNRGFVRELNNRLSNARKQLMKNHIKNAAKRISKFMERVQKVYEKNDKSNNPRFVTDDGYRFLYYNIKLNIF